MNKKLIALAVAAAFAAPSAMAEVVVYGKAHADVRMTDDGTVDTWSVNSNASRLGFKGAEDLSNGLKAIFKYEMSYDIDGDDADAPINGARNAYVGLAGDFGSLTVGRHDTPAKSAYYATGNDHLGDSVIDFNATGGFTERRRNNAITYWSNNLSGLKFGAQIQPGETTTDNGLADSASLGVSYAGHGLKLGAGYETTAGTEDEKMFQLGGSYTMGNITVGGNFEQNDDYQGNANAEYTAIGVAAKAQFGNNAVIANYGNREAENAAGTTTTDTDRFGVALQHTLSKRSNVYVAYSQEDPASGNDTDYFAVGMMHNF